MWRKHQSSLFNERQFIPGLPATATAAAAATITDEGKKKKNFLLADSYFFKWSLLYCYMFCHPLPPANKNLPAVNLGSNKAGGKKKSLFAVSKKKKRRSWRTLLTTTTWRTRTSRASGVSRVDTLALLTKYVCRSRCPAGPVVPADRRELVLHYQRKIALTTWRFLG